MPDTKLKDVTEVTTPILDAFIYTVHSPTGANTDVAMTPGNLLKVIDLLTEDTSPVAGDFLISYDTSAGGVKKVDCANMGAAIGAGLTANPLSQFAATNSAQLAGVLSDETGEGALVFGTSPTLVTPVLGTPSSGALGSCTAYEGAAVASTGEAGGTKYLREDGDGSCSWQTPAGSGDFLASGAVAMTGDFDGDGNNIDDIGVVFLREQAAADVDVAGSGQLWVKTATPNQLWFTDDVGTDTQLGAGASLTNWTESTGTETTAYTAFLATNAATDVHAVISPKGTGALVANIPDGTAAGGNDRGGNAVDLQVKRIAATEVASGVGSTLLGGINGTASGNYSVAVGGSNNTVTSHYGVCLGGQSNTVASSAAVVGGAENTAGEKYSVVSGYHGHTTRYGEVAQGWGAATALGQHQGSRCVLAGTTTDATETTLNLGDPGYRLWVPTDSVLCGRIDVAAVSSDGAKRDGFYADFAIYNDGGTTALIGTPVATQHASEAWSISVEADDTNDALVVKVTGESATTIDWTAVVQFAQAKT
jgi:hypothetical protein